MSDDQVGFGPTPKKRANPGETWLKELLDVATDDEAEEHLTEWEQQFARSRLDALTKYGYREPSDGQQKALEKIEEKLINARLL